MSCSLKPFVELFVALCGWVFGVFIWVEYRNGGLSADSDLVQALLHAITSPLTVVLALAGVAVALGRCFVTLKEHS